MQLYQPKPLGTMPLATTPLVTIPLVTMPLGAMPLVTMALIEGRVRLLILRHEYAIQLCLIEATIPHTHCMVLTSWKTGIAGRRYGTVT